MEEIIKTIIPADSWSAVYAENGEISISPLICFALVYTVDETGGRDDCRRVEALGVPGPSRDRHGHPDR